MKSKGTILIVDDEEDIRFTLSELLKKDGYEVETASNGQEALEKISETNFDAIFLDIRMPVMDGLTTLEKIKEKNQDVPVIMISAYGLNDVAYKALHDFNAFYFVSKPFKIEEVRALAERAVRTYRSLSEVQQLKEKLALAEEYKFENIVGSSSQMKEIFQLIKQVAKTDATVLIYGESGTGKELVARAIHRHSLRKNKPFVEINCAAIPEGLLESELFGHEKGAFTGAVAQKQGKFELADGGTLFLDEIGDMSLATQAKVLRVLQEQKFERVGGTTPISVDIRVIAATNKDLAKGVQEKWFREDLYFRLNVVPIYLPPLRERKEDINLLVCHFLDIYNKKYNKNVKGVTDTVMDFFMRYHWPGNVRELENVIQRAVVLTEKDVIDEEFLPIIMQHIPKKDKIAVSQKEESDRATEGINIQPLEETLSKTIADVEKKEILKALELTSWNKTKAAEYLKISRKTLHQKIKAYNIIPPEDSKYFDSDEEEL